ncbi:hypothetical protein SAMN05880574_12137 [Chryseobacterium sp. RU37D]|uniref:hypothetical protein n=1 Tax=Chryseobacterium sp. RU37D TaxID=1907397 RepID=UPI000956CE89|nr:hypothetical protein [Chryseobacterium sp. RU37D]SIQ69604.1 hypothetical protein SAMN05880574_12137 [Chryseobacterium sp. RU37D]
MKKLFHLSIFTVILACLTACKHQGKEEIALQNIAIEHNNTDKITKNIYTDEYGDQLEVTINKTQNTTIIRLNGKTYELKKNEEMPEYTAGDAEYQYSNIRGDITFLKKDYNMVLFHHKEKTSSPNTKMASY